MRFTIRDLIWLTIVVALAVGWWMDHRRHEKWVEGLLQGIIDTKRAADASERNAKLSTISPVKPAQ